MIKLTKIIKHLFSKHVPRHPKTPDITKRTPMATIEDDSMFKMSPRLISTTCNVLRSWSASNGMIFILIAVPAIS